MTKREVTLMATLAYTILSPAQTSGDTLPDHIIFRTQQRVSTGLGGLDAMDGRCQSKAEAAGLDGTWLALLSASGAGNSAKERLEAAGADGPFFNMISQQLASDLDDLFDGDLTATVFVDEFGQTIHNNGKVWTATSPDGSYAGSSYADWTSFSGNVH